MSELVTVSMTSGFSKEEILRECSKGMRLLNISKDGEMRIIEIVACHCGAINAQGRRRVVITGRVCK